MESERLDVIDTRFYDRCCHTGMAGFLCAGRGGAGRGGEDLLDEAVDHVAEGGPGEGGPVGPERDDAVQAGPEHGSGQERVGVGVLAGECLGGGVRDQGECWRAG